MAARTTTVTPKKIAVPVYQWTGVDKRGKSMTGELPARNEALAMADVRRQNPGLDRIKLKAKRKPLFGGAGKKITGGNIAMVARQLATMMKAGVPLVGSLDIMSSSQDNPRLGRLLADVRDDLSSGQSLYEALSKHPLQFDGLFCNLVRAGEAAGVLDTILDTVATYKEKTEALKGKIKKALFYPIAVMCIAGLVSAILLLYVVPQFQTLFQGMGADLPAFTQVLVDMSNFLQKTWWLILMIIIGSIFAIKRLFRTSEKVRNVFDSMMLRTPIIGKILHGAAIARFSRTLAITFSAGVPLVEAMDTVAGATGSERYRAAVMKIKEDVAVGYPMHVAMKQVNLFPNIVTQMTAIGEESGSLDTMLSKVADFYEQEVSNSVDALSSLLEPLIMVVLGGLIGSMVIGMYLPIFKLAETAG